MRLFVPLFVLSINSLAQIPIEHVNLKNGTGLSAYDPVSYFEGSPVMGREAIEYELDGVRYRFATEANREAFKADPQQYLPEYGGWCAYAMLDGEKVEIDPETFKIIEGKLYLYYNGFWGDTLKRWNKKLARAEESSLVSQADEAWRKILEK